MRSGIPDRRENIHIVVEGLQPRVDVQYHPGTTSSDSVLVRNRFSLTGTLREQSLLGHLPDSLGLPLHPGYANVGVVEEIVTAHGQLARGDVVVIPACHSTYTTLTKASLSDLPGFFLQRVPADVDMVDATFAPLVSLSLYLTRQAPQALGGPVVLLGCGLLGVVLLRVLQLADVDAIVYTGDDDMPRELIESGAGVVLGYKRLLPKEMVGKVQVVFVLSSSVWCSQAVATLSSIQGGPAIVSALLNDDSDSNGKHLAWLGYDAFKEALDLLRSGELIVRDLVVQHVHAEIADQVYGAIQQNRYRGRAIVYDW
jgi:D-arabinose 1-dehydrogenase-like Zn-dependent alcohol dehydrogenase